MVRRVVGLICAFVLVVAGVVALAGSAAAAAGWGWTETNVNGSSGSTSFGWGASNQCLPISGDWDHYGVDHVGLACWSSAGWVWHEDTGGQGGGQISFGWGGGAYTPTNCTPIVGDWDHYGVDHVGLACWSSAGWVWHEDTGGLGGGQISFGWGGGADSTANCSPVVGDWANYGVDHVGLACWSSAGWVWREDTGGLGGGQISFGWGGGADSTANCSPISGDWNRYGVDHVGLACWSSTGWVWREDTGAQGGGQISFGWGGAGATQPTTIPLTGDWNGDTVTTVALVNSGGLQAGTGTSNQGAAIVSAAKMELGISYCLGAGGQHGPTSGCGLSEAFDCSGLSLFAVYQATGILLPHLASAQYDDAQGLGGKQVARSDLQPGDLVFFTGALQPGEDPPGHVGIYVGNGQMINAYDINYPVQIQPLISGYIGAVRYWH